MAVLQVQQVAAPDLSSTSSILANAGKSFDSGMQSAKDLLTSYQAGQQSKGDALLLGELAGLKTEDELASFLGSTDFSKLNLSEGMRANVLGARATILGNDATRQNTVNATDSNARAWNADGRAEAAEGRTAAEYLDGVNQRTELRGLTPYVVGATEEGRRYGVDGPTQGSSGISADNPIFSDFMGTVQKGGVTNPYALAAIAATGSHESGFSAKNAAGSWSDPSESGRPGTAGGIMSWNNERFDKMKAYTNGDLSGAAQAAYFLNEDPALITALQGAKSTEEAISLMNNAWRFAGYDRAGGEAGRRAQTAAGLVGMFGGTSTFPVSENPASYGAGAALAGALGNTKYMTPDQATKLLGYGYDAQTTGQGLIDEREAKRIAELGSEATLSAITDPNNLTADAVRRDLAATPGLPASAILGLTGQNLDAQAGIIAPATSESSVVTDALTRSAATNASADAADPQARAIALAQTFKDSGDVGGTLLSEFNVPEGTGMDSAYVTRRITKMADDAGVTPEQMAATLSSTVQGNFGQFDAMLNAASDTDMYRSVMGIADKAYGPEVMSAYEKSQSDISARDAATEATRLRLSTAKTSAAKLPAGSTERAEADRKIRLTEAAIVAEKNPIEARKNTMDYLSGRVIGFDPSSVAGNRAQLEGFIQNDNSLSEEQKLLLILGLRV